MMAETETCTHPDDRLRARVSPTDGAGFYVCTCGVEVTVGEKWYRAHPEGCPHYHWWIKDERCVCGTLMPQGESDA